MITKVLMLVAFATTAFVNAGIASASTVSYQFGNLLAGSFTPSAVFANLDVTTTDNLTYGFKLTANDLNSLFTTNAFVGSVAVDYSGSTLPSATLVGSSNGVSSIDVSPGNGPTGIYDFRYVYGMGNDRLRALESVSWTSTFLNVQAFDGNDFALHVQGLLCTFKV